MIDFKLEFTYEEETKPSLTGASGRIDQGKCIVLCGNSGCGKTTLMRTMNRLIPQFYEGELNGFCNINGACLEDLAIGEVGETVASVFQDPRSQFFTMNSNTELAFALENFSTPVSEIHKRVQQAFEVFSLEHLYNRNVFELSSGEKQLVAILCMWVQNNNICLLDEPTANLDYIAIEQLAKALTILKQQGKTIVVNEHRLYYLAGIADEYWKMDKGTIEQTFTSEQFKAFSTKELNDMGLRTNNLDDLFYQNMASKVATSNAEIFDVEDLSYKYRKNKTNTLQRLSYKAHKGDIVAVVGANGCGKTTFGKVICGLLKKKTETFS